MSSHQPTDRQLREARERLSEQKGIAFELDEKIREEHERLERMVREVKRGIATLDIKRQEIEKEIQTTKEFLSPMRRLPDDLVRQLFLACFDDSAYAGWRLAAVCLSWRRLALDMPRLWSKVSRIVNP